MAPNDVQFSLPFTNEESDDSIQPPENIVIQSNSYDNSLCVDTSAFVGKKTKEMPLKNRIGSCLIPTVSDRVLIKY